MFIPRSVGSKLSCCVEPFLLQKASVAESFELMCINSLTKTTNDASE